MLEHTMTEYLILLNTILNEDKAYTYMPTTKP